MAASDARLAPRKNEATVIPVVFFKNDGTVIATWTGADSEISQDYGQAADCTNEATEVDAPVSGKWGVGYLELTADEMNCDFVLVKATIANTGALPFIWSCVPESAGDIRSDAVMLGGAAQSATDLKDFADTGYDPAAHKVQGVVLTDTLTTYTSNTPQTGDAYAAVGNLNDFDPASDAVANVTLVDTTTDLTNAPTGMSTFDPATDEVDIGAVKGTGVTSVDDFKATGFNTTTPPTAAAIADQVWNETMADHVAAGSTGEKLNAAGASSDPLLNAVPGAYAAGTAGYNLGSIDEIKAKTDTIGASSFPVASPLTSSKTADIVQGDDHFATDGRSLDFTYSGMPSFVGGSPVMKVASIDGRTTVLSLSGTVVSATELRFEPPSAQTALLDVGEHPFEIEITLSNGHITTLTSLDDGVATVRRQAP